MAEELGINEIQEAIDAVVDVIISVDEALEDGNISLAEGISLGVEAVPDFVEVWNDRALLIAQGKDLSLDELAELVNGVLVKFDISNDKAEAVVKKALAVIVAGAELGIAIKELKE